MINKKHYVLVTQAVLNSLDKRMVGRVIDIKDLCSILENTLFQVFNPRDFNLNQLDFTVERKYEKTLTTNEIQTSGEYTSLEVWKRKSQIDECLSIFVSSRERLIYFDSDKWEKFKYSMLQVFVHELIHVDQSRKRFGDFYGVSAANSRTSVDYYAEPDEIDAYAFNGAIDLLALESTLSEVMDVTWQTLIKTGAARKLSIEFASYYDIFEYTNRKVLNRYLKRVVKYIDYLQTTKVKGVKYDLYQQAS